MNHTGALSADPKTDVYYATVLSPEDAEQFFKLYVNLDLGELQKNIIPYEHARKIRKLSYIQKNL